jgi:hypothetical protein
MELVELNHMCLKQKTLSKSGQTALPP